MDMKPRTQSSEGIAKSRSATESKWMDDSITCPNLACSQILNQESSARIRKLQHSVAVRRLAEAQTDLFFESSSTRRGLRQRTIPRLSRNWNITLMSDISSENSVLERMQSRGAGAMAARGTPSIDIPAICPSELAGPRTDLATRGLGMRPIENSLQI